MEPQPALAYEYATASAARPVTGLRLVPRVEARQELTGEVLGNLLRDSGEGCDLRRWWTQICSGELVFTKFVIGETHAFAVLSTRSAGDAAKHAITERRRRILEQVLRGESLKCVSMDLGYASSTVSAELKHLLEDMGVGSRITDLPLFVPQLWWAAQSSMRADARWTDIRFADAGRRILALPRAELSWLRRLPHAEAEVCTMLLAGHSYAQIAKQRAASERTIANQVASVFRRFHVSGRVALLAKIASQGAGCRVDLD